MKSRMFGAAIFATLGGFLLSACASSSTPTAQTPKGPLYAAQSALAARDCTTARTEAKLSMKEAVTADAMIVLGTCDELEGKADEAIARYEDALDVDSRATEASWKLAHLLLELGRTDKAIGVAKRALASAKEDPEMWQLLAEIDEQLGDHPAAEKAFAHAAASFRLAVKTHPGDARLRVKYAHALLVAGNDAEAKSELVDALSLAGTDIATVEEAALELSTVGDPQRCVEALDRLLVDSNAIVVEKEHATVLAERASCKYAAKDLAGARADADASLAIEPSLELHLQAARWDEQAGDRPGCSRHYVAASKLAVGTSYEKEAQLGAQRCGS